MLVHENFSLSHFLLTLSLSLYWILFGLDGCSGSFVTKDVIFFITWFWSFTWWAITLVGVLIEHVIIFNDLDIHVVIVIHFSHEAHVDECVELSLLILWPDIFLLIHIQRKVLPFCWLNLCLSWFALCYLFDFLLYFSWVCKVIGFFLLSSPFFLGHIF